MSRGCGAELCWNSTGQGCICDASFLEPDPVEKRSTHDLDRFADDGNPHCGGDR